ncbi:MAG: hypothetical protein HQM10_27145 [Candidatus Riflebacteria bacterium]|nr:hypothetical protein [Candidatus Riflebacteria bacterium]
MTIVYDQSIIVYFDILGFKEMVKNSSALSIWELLTKFRNKSKVKEDEQEMFGKQFSNFSDTVIISTKIQSKLNKKQPWGIFFHELIEMIYLQVALLQSQKVFVRGVMTIGHIIHKDNLFFGPGLIKAYELERDVSVYPRIIIDPKIIEIYLTTSLLKSANHDIITDWSYIKNLIRKSSDGIYFIDYLKAINTEIDDFDDYCSFLSLHRELIIENASKFKDLSKISAKYSWLAEYHNEIVKELITEEKQDSFLITHKDVKAIV